MAKDNGTANKAPTQSERPLEVAVDLNKFKYSCSTELQQHMFGLLEKLNKKGPFKVTIIKFLAGDHSRSSLEWLDGNRMGVSGKYYLQGGGSERVRILLTRMGETIQYHEGLFRELKGTDFDFPEVNLKPDEEEKPAPEPAEPASPQSARPEVPPVPPKWPPDDDDLETILSVLADQSQGGWIDTPEALAFLGDLVDSRITDKTGADLLNLLLGKTMLKIEHGGYRIIPERIREAERAAQKAVSAAGVITTKKEDEAAKQIPQLPAAMLAKLAELHQTSLRQKEVSERRFNLQAKIANAKATKASKIRELEAQQVTELNSFIANQKRIRDGLELELDAQRKPDEEEHARLDKELDPNGPLTLGAKQYGKFMNGEMFKT